MEYNLQDHVQQAIVIIYKSCSSGKLLTEYKLWDKLDFHAKEIALKETSWIRQAAKQRVPLEEAQEFNAITQGEVL